MGVKYIKAGKENLERHIPLFERSIDRGRKDEEYLFIPLKAYIEAIRGHKKTEEELKRARKELKKENTLRKYLESRYELLLAEYPSKEEVRKFEIEIVFPESWERGFIEYGTEEKEEEVTIPIAGVNRNIFAFPDVFAIPELSHRLVQRVKPEAKTSTLQELSPQYMLVDRCTKFVFAPIAALSFALGLVFYLYANVGMAVGLVGIGITSLLLTIVFSITKSSLKE
jgi:hypothetical protein